MFRPDEAAQFATAFYGCIFAAVIPVAIEPPMTREVRASVSYMEVGNGDCYMYIPHAKKQTSHLCYPHGGAVSGFSCTIGSHLSELHLSLITYQ